MYALLALGFTLVYGILELINFAHFNVFMVGSFIGLWSCCRRSGCPGRSVILTGLPLVGVLLAAFMVTMVFCRRARRRDRAAVAAPACATSRGRRR